MVREAAALAPSLPGGLAVEINLSCPNIAGKPPLAYDFDALRDYLGTVFAAGPPPPTLAVGAKSDAVVLILSSILVCFLFFF